MIAVRLRMERMVAVAAVFVVVAALLPIFPPSVTAQVNDPSPTIQGESDPSIAENTTRVSDYDVVKGSDTPDRVTWVLLGTDRDSFRINAAGMLSFNRAPNFEQPGSADNANVYSLIIAASADGMATNHLPVTVTVTNADDPGRVTVAGGFSPATEKTAALIDEDVTPSTNIGWQWQSQGVGQTGFTDIPGETNSTFTPGETRRGETIRAVATYDDSIGTGTDTAMSEGIRLRSQPSSGTWSQEWFITPNQAPASVERQIDVGLRLTYEFDVNSASDVESIEVVNKNPSTALYFGISAPVNEIEFPAPDPGGSSTASRTRVSLGLASCDLPTDAEIAAITTTTTLRVVCEFRGDDLTVKTPSQAGSYELTWQARSPGIPTRPGRPASGIATTQLTLAAVINGVEERYTPIDGLTGDIGMLTLLASDTAYPGAVRNLMFTTPSSGQGTLDISWTEPDNTDTVDLDIHQYLIQYRPSDIDAPDRRWDWQEVAVPENDPADGGYSYSLTGLWPGREYEVRVAADNRIETPPPTSDTTGPTSMSQTSPTSDTTTPTSVTMPPTSDTTEPPAPPTATSSSSTTLTSTPTSDTTAPTTMPPMSETTAPTTPTSETTAPTSPTSETTAPTSPTSETTAPTSPTSETTAPTSPTSETTAPTSPTSETTAPTSPTSETTAPTSPTSETMPPTTVITIPPTGSIGIWTTGTGTSSGERVAINFGAITPSDTQTEGARFSLPITVTGTIIEPVRIQWGFYKTTGNRSLSNRFDHSNNFLQLSPGDTTAQLDIVSIDDQIDQSDGQEFQLRASITPLGPYLINAHIRSITLNDNDEPPVATPTITGWTLWTRVNENLTATNLTFGSDDTGVTWSLEGDDSIWFNIDSDGALTFNSPPDFERPVASHRANHFRLVVVATGDPAGSTPGVTKTKDFNVLVLNVEEVPTLVSDAPSTVLLGIDVTRTLVLDDILSADSTTTPTYTVSSSDPAIATVTDPLSPTATEFTITGVTEGETTVTVTVNDGVNDAVSHDITVTVDNVPTVSTPLADLPETGLISAATDDIVVTLAGVFSDTDFTDALTYSVSSSDTAVATVSPTVPTTSFTIDIVGPGTTTIAVTASDVQEQVVTDEFLVTVLAEPPTAVMLEAGNGDGHDQDRSIEVSWTVPTVATGIENYVIAYRRADIGGGVAGEWSDSIDVPGGSTTNTQVITPTAGLTEGGYQVRVGSVATGVDTAWSTVSAEVTVAAPITLSFSSLEIQARESDSSTQRRVEYSVALSGTRSEDVDFEITYDNVTTTNDDYNQASIVKTISAENLGTAAGHFDDSVLPFHSVTDDELVEGDETFMAMLSVTDGDVVAGTERVEVTIIDNDDAEVELVSPAATTVAEDVDGGRLSRFDFELSLSAQVDAAVTVDWELSGADAADVVGGMTSGTVRFPARSTTPQPVAIEVVDDDVAEAEEEWTFSLSEPVTALVRADSSVPVSLATSAADVMLTVEASDLAIGPEVSGVTASQGGMDGVDPDTTLSVAWTAPMNWDGGYVVEYAQDTDRSVLENLSLETWTGWTAITPVSGVTATISDTDVVQGQFYRFRVATVTDELTIPSWQLSNVVGPAEPIEASLGSDMVPVGEGDGSVDIEVTLSGPRSVTVSVMVMVSAGSAATPDDFGEPSWGSNTGSGGMVQVDFAVGEVSQMLMVPVVSDDLVESDETFTVALVSPAQAGEVEVDTSAVSVTITDDDMAMVGLSIDDDGTSVSSISVVEDRAMSSDPNSSVSLVLTLSEMVDADVTVTLTVGGNAGDGDIRWTATGATGLSEQVIFPANTLMQTVALEFVDDETPEGEETMSVTVSDPQVVLVRELEAVTVDSGSESVSVVVAASDGGTPPPAVSGVSASVGQMVGGVLVDADRVISVSWAVPSDTAGLGGYVARFVPDPGGGVSPAEEDWLLGTPVEDVAAGSLLLSADDGVEAGTDYLVQVSAFRQGAEIYAWVDAAAGVMTADAVRVSLSDDSEVSETPAVANSNNSVTVTASLSGLLSSPVSVDVSTVAGTAGLDDFVGLSEQTVMIAAGGLDAEFVVEVSDDEVVEGTEVFTVEIVGDPVGALADPAGGVVSVTVTDDDTAMVSTVWAGADPGVGVLPSVSEDVFGGVASELSYSVVLDMEVAAEVVVDWEIVTDTDVTDSDFATVPLSGQVIFPADSVAGASMPVVVSVADDTVVESEERVLFRISNPVVMLSGRDDTPVSVDSTASEVAANIESSDQPDPARQPTNVTVSAGDDMGRDADRVFTIGWTAPTNNANVSGYQLAYRLDTADSWTDIELVTDLTATSYSWVPVPRLAAGSYLVSVQTVGNNQDAVASTEPVVVSPISAAITETSLTVDEGSSGQLTVTLSGARSVEVVIGMVATEGTAVAADYMVLTEVRFAAGETSKTVDVSAVSDTDIEADETFMVALVSPAQAGEVEVETSAVSVTITDDDMATVGLSIDDDGTSVSSISVDEDRAMSSDPNNSVSLVLTLSDMVPEPVTVTFSARGNVNAGDIGWTDTIQMVTIPAGMTTHRLDLEIVDDDTPEGPEAFKVTVSDPQVVLVRELEAVTVDSGSESVSVVVAASDGGTPPPAVSGVSASVGQMVGGVLVDADRLISVSWTAPSDTAGLGGYVARFVRDPGGGVSPAEEDWLLGTPVEDAAASKIMLSADDGVEAGIEYLVQVSAFRQGEQLYDWVQAASGVQTAAAVLVSLDSSVGEVAETPAVANTNNSVMVTASLSGLLSSPVSLDVSTVAGTAGLDDFVGLSEQTVTIAAGEMSAEFVVEVADDELVEGDEVFTVEIVGDPVGALVDPAGGVVSVTVTDDDTAMVSTVWAGADPGVGVLPSISEDVFGGVASELSYSVVLDRVVAAEVVVDWEIVTDTDVTDSDFATVPLSGQVIFPADSVAGAAMPVVVTVADDTVVESEERVLFRISNPVVMLSGRDDTPVSVDSTASEVTAVIKISDQTDPARQPTNVTVSAGDDMGRDADRVFTIDWVVPTDNNDVSGYQLAYRLDTADSWTDIELVSDPTATSYAWTPSPRLAAGSYLVSVEAVGNNQDAVASAEPVVVVPISAAITETSLTVAEGSSGQLTVTLSGARSVEVVIGIDVTPGSAVADDYMVPADVRFAAGETSVAVDVSAATDSAVESSESFEIALRSPVQSGEVGVDTTVVVVTINNTTVAPSTGGVGVVPVQQPPQPPTTAPSFTDTVGNTHETNIGRLAELGITRGCNPPENTRYCPDRPVTRGEMATFMVRAFTLPASGSNLFDDDNGNTHETNINALAAAEITRGCNPPDNTRYCPDRPVTRAQMATFIARALGLVDGAGDFIDTSESVHQNDINRIATVGITRGCNPPANTRYCPDRAVTRAEMATFLIRATDL